MIGRKYPELAGISRSTMPCWGLSPLACSFGDNSENYRALAEARRTGKDDAKRTSTSQGLQGKVRQTDVT